MPVESPDFEVGKGEDSEKPLILEGVDCDVPSVKRKLKMPDGKTVYYPQDMWPPVPGQKCRPHIRKKGEGLVPITSGYIGAFFPGGFEKMADGSNYQMKTIVRRLYENFPGYEQTPYTGPFADQLEAQGFKVPTWEPIKLRERKKR